jgi:DNA sulfur modification protein DndB
MDALSETAVSFWDEVAKYMPEWRMVRDGKMSASDVRREFIHTHGIALLAIGKAGHDLLSASESTWRSGLKGLRKIDWSRTNASLWEGRAMIGGRVSKAANNVILTTNALKTQLGLELTAEERRVESSLTKRGNG